MKRKLAAAASCAALSGLVLAVSFPATGAGATRGHLPHFSLIATPIRLAQAPRIFLGAFARLPRGKRGGVRVGRTHLNGVTIEAIGNRHLVCYVQWNKQHVGVGACDSFRGAVRRGGITSFSPCGGDEAGTTRISGIAVNGVTELGVDRRADGTIEETIPVVGNGFSVDLENRGLILHGIGDARASRVEFKYPLRRVAAHGGGCKAGESTSASG